MGYIMVVGGEGTSVKDKKRPVTAGNFHKTIPRVLINLSCSSVQVVDCLRRNFPFDLFTRPAPHSRCNKDGR